MMAITKYNELKRFIVKFLFIIILFIFLDILTGSIFNILYKKQSNDDYGSLNYTINHLSADAMIFGSSRAQNHYNSNILDSCFGFRFFNAGSGGQTMLYNLAVFKSVIKRNKPKIVIIDIVPFAIEYSKDAYDKLEVLLPFTSDENIRRILSLREGYWKENLIKSYRFNSKIHELLDFKKKKNDFTGFYGLEGEIDTFKCTQNNQFKSLEDFIHLLDSNQINALREIENECHMNQINLLVIISPIYTCPDEYYYMQQYLNKNFPELKLYSFVDSTDFKNSKLFYDEIHLNRSGANLFTSKICKIIKNNLDL